MSVSKPLWEPSQARIAGANVTAFARAAIREWGLKFNTYPEFYQWSVDAPEQFWVSLWQYAAVKARTRGERVLVHGERMPGARSARRRRGGWQPRRRLPAEPAADGDGDARRREHRRHLVVLLPRFRRAGRARPLRTDRTQGPV